VLATDGLPNDLPGMSLAAATRRRPACCRPSRAAAADITTFVISLAGTDKPLEAHLADVAKHGKSQGSERAHFQPADAGRSREQTAHGA
jgi:hypothetical protein